MIGGPALAIALPEDPPGSANDAPALAMPAHFVGKTAAHKKLRAAWDDLLARTDRKLHVPENAFTFEFAAELLAKRRAGDELKATELKELKAHLVELGLAKETNEGAKQKGKLSKYLAATG